MRQWNGETPELIYNYWKYHIRLCANEDVYRFYKSLTMAERLEFQRRVAELLKQKLNNMGVKV